MVDINKAWEAGENGILLSASDGSNVIWMGGASGAPSFSAPQGSFYHDTTNNQFYYNTAVGNNWVKLGADKIAFSPPTGFSSTNVADAIEEAKSDAVNLPRYPFVQNHTGTLVNGQLVGYSSLQNNPILIPVKSKLAEVSFINNNAADADFRFYKGTETPSNLFFTWDLNDTTQATVTSASFTSPTFNAGDLYRVFYDDQGTNVTGMTMVSFFQAVE